MTNICAAGDQKSKRIHRWFRKKKDDDRNSYSSDSLKVNIGDLANAEELMKIPIHDQSKSDNIIEDLQILNGIRTHSKDILNILKTLDLFNYGEKDTGRKLLSIAAEADWYEGIVVLLNRGVDINETDRENRTALMNCLTSTNLNILIALIKRPECNLDMQSLTGHTATHYAVMMNKISFFEILIKSGARLDLRNDKGENILHQIIEYKRKECWKIVKNFYKSDSNGIIYLKHLINTETFENQTCLALTYQHQPDIYFFKELLPFSNLTLRTIEEFQSWTKASKLIRNLLSYKKSL